MTSPEIFLYENDIPTDLDFGDSVAVDTEAMGLLNMRDRLCVVQLSSGDGKAHLVKFSGDNYSAQNLKKLLADEKVTKIFHFARFDIAIMTHYLGVMTQNIYCTKIASAMARTFTDKHGLKDLTHDLIGVDLSKEQQSSDWGADTLTEEQQRYAASDVLYLHRLKEKLDAMLEREGRLELAQRVFKALPVRAELDLAGWANVDIFSHHPVGKY